MRANCPRLEPIKVIHLITGLGVGGAETMLHKLLSGMEKSRFQNSVFSMTELGPMARRIQALGIDVQSLDLRRTLPDPRGVFRFLKRVRSWQPDLIQTWMYHADLLGGLVGAIAGDIPVVWNIRNSGVHGNVGGWMTMGLARLCAGLSPYLPARIVCCAEMGRHGHIRLGYTPTKFVVIPNGFDLDGYKPNPMAADICEARFGIPPARDVIFLPARYHPHKDHETFFRAAQICRAEFPDTLFVLCGEGITWDNVRLVAQIDYAGIRKEAVLLGRLVPEDVAIIMARSALTTSTSRCEGFPNIIGEAMGCEKICVVTDAGDSAHIVGDTGIVVPTQSPDALANAWARVLSLSDEERAKGGRVARQRVETRFGLPAVVSQYQDLYEELVQRRTPV